MTTPIDTEKNPPSGERMRLPAVPTVTATTSAQVLAALKEIIEVREGRRGSKYEKAVTWRDLWEIGLIGIQSGGKNVININQGPVKAINGVPDTDGPQFRALFEKFEAELKATPGFKKLNRLIGSVDDLESLPEELRRLVSTSIADEALKRGAAIQEVRQVIQTDSLSFAAKVEEVTAAVGQVSAGVRHIDSAYATKTRALASSVTTVEARLDNARGSGVTVEQALTADADSITGLEGTYTLRINVDGKIAGFALGSTASVSSAIFQVDKFGIYNSTGGVDTIIFGVDGSGVYINSNVRVAGSIAASQITAGTTSDARGSVELLGFSTVLKVTRSSSTTTPAVFVSDTAGTSTESLRVSSNSTATYSVLFTSGSTTVFGAESSNSGFSAAKFKNAASSKEVWLAPSSYAVYSPSGGGKHYAVDGLGPFTGFHDGLIVKGMQYEPGDIVVSAGIAYRHDVSNHIPYVVLSSAPRMKNARGVITEHRILDEFVTLPYEMWWELVDTHDVAAFNAVGEGMINVCGENGDIEDGDLIVTSSIPGKGMRQDDDIVRNITVAEACESVHFDYAEQIKTIACIYRK